MLAAVLTTLFSICGAAQAFPGNNGRIAFVSSGEIRTVEPDGSDVISLGPGSTPRWSPDGTKIAFITGRDLGVMNADGSDRHVVAEPSQGSIDGIAWSPDGDQLVYTQTNCSASGCGGAMLRVNADGSGRTVVENSGLIPYQPDWSPDGSTIAYDIFNDHWEEEIWAVSPDGTNRRALTSDGGNDFGYHSPRWSPNGQKILHSFTAARSTLPFLRIMNADGSNPAAIPGTTRASLGGWSPDGRKIVFSQFTAGQNDIWVMNADGSDATPIYSSGAYPDWQPIPINAYPRPRVASPTQVSLVPAYSPCTASNRTHGPPLAFESCNPPLKSSLAATFGTPDANGAPAKGSGLVRYVALGGDMRIELELFDVRDHSTMADYTDGLRLRIPVRITDKRNTPHPGGPGAATVADATLAAAVPCAATADADVGASCLLTTTVNAIYPGAVAAGARSVWELGQVQVEDGGADGDPDTAGDNTLFAVQGVFVP